MTWWYSVFSPHLTLWLVYGGWVQVQEVIYIQGISGLQLRGWNPTFPININHQIAFCIISASIFFCLFSELNWALNSLKLMFSSLAEVKCWNICGRLLKSFLQNGKFHINFCLGTLQNAQWPHAQWPHAQSVSQAIHCALNWKFELIVLPQNA